MSEITYMDCWRFIAPFLPVKSEYEQDVYLMTFRALKEAEDRREKKSNDPVEDKP